jgi:hypothetical protein
MESYNCPFCLSTHTNKGTIEVAAYTLPTGARPDRVSQAELYPKGHCTSIGPLTKLHSQEGTWFPTLPLFPLYACIST